MTEPKPEVSLDELAALCARQFTSLQKDMATREDVGELSREIEALRAVTAEELHDLRRETQQELAGLRASAKETHEAVRELSRQITALTTVLGRSVEQRLTRLEEHLS
jgi:uncharacterized coiled-coil DUF342 family protein